MKRLFVAALLLAVTSSAVAGLVELRVNPDDAETSYEYGNIITIEVYCSGFRQNHPLDTIKVMEMDNVTSDNGGIASGPEFHPDIDGGLSSPGSPGVDGYLIRGPIGSVPGTTDTGLSDPSWGYRFEYHVPDLSYSSNITIALEGFVIKNVAGQTMTGYTLNDELDLHVVPEPAALLLFGLGGLLLRKRH